MSLKDVLEELNYQRSIFLAEPVNISKNILKKIDELLDKTEQLLNEEDVSNKILIGDHVNLVIRYDDGEVEYANYFLGMDVHENTISIFSPLGSALYGANINDTLSYNVKEHHIEATILNVLDADYEEISTPDLIEEGSAKKKINN